MSKAAQEAKTEKMNRIANLTNPPRITQTEKERIKSVFGLEPEIYKALRDCFFGFELDENQNEMLKLSYAVKDLIKKQFLPELNKVIAFGQNYDLWQTQDIKNANPDSYEYFYEAKQKILEMIKKSLERLENPTLKGVDLSVKEKDFTFIIARNGYISYIDQQIRFLMQYAIQDILSEEEVQAMLRMNSAK